MRAVTDDSFDRDVLAAGRPVVVDFWAPWCGPCKAVEPILAQLAAEHRGRVEFVRLDVDANPATASRFGVLALPTAILYADGEARAAIAGARKRTDYERAWASWLSEPPAQRGDA